MFRLFVSAIASILRKQAARNAARSSRARGLRARIARGKVGARSASLIAAELLEEAGEALAEAAEESEQLISQAYGEAIETMGGMVANAGQESVFYSRVIPGFEDSFANSDPATGWDDVNIGEYMAFMGEIVGEGNSIMSAAYEQARSILDSAEGEAADLEGSAFELEEGEESEDSDLFR
jgi:hypothetical protein